MNTTTSLRAAAAAARGVSASLLRSISRPTAAAAIGTELQLLQQPAPLAAASSCQDVKVVMSRGMSAAAAAAGATPFGQAQVEAADAEPSSSGSAAAASAAAMPFESTTIADLLGTKGASEDGSWLFCTTEDTVYDAVKSMTSHNVGALLVTKGDSSGTIAGIITERDYLRKIIVHGRSSKTTKVGDIMTEENKLITVSPQTKLLVAMELMTENRIRHIPVVEDRKMKGMVSIGDVVKAVVSEHREEVARLSDYIKGSY